MLWKIIWLCLKKLKIELPYDLQFYFWVHVQKNWKQDLKEILIHPLFIAVLFTTTKTRKPDQVSINGWISHCAKWKKYITKNTISFCLSEVVRVVKIIKKESEVVFARVCDEGKMRNYYLMGIVFQFYKMKELWKWMMVIVAQCNKLVFKRVKMG
jgi:hypothetical protein